MSRNTEISSRNLIRACTATVLSLSALAFAPRVLAQPAPDPQAEAEAESKKFVNSLAWKKGPAAAELGTEAEIKLPAGYMFIGPADTRKLLESWDNIVDGSDLGLVTPADGKLDWFVVFDFDSSGYVKDDEKDKLDADAMLQTFRESNKRSNEERQRQNKPLLTLVGWEQKPRYDSATNSLEWGLRYESGGHPVVNYFMRRLGRGGVMQINLVVEPESLSTTLPACKTMLGGFSYKPGHKYAEFKSGDKIAQYGLTALVTGGAVAVALKTGILQKFGKLIVVAVVGVIAVIGKFFKKLFGRGETVN